MACQELQTNGLSGVTVLWLVRSYRLMACLKWQTYGLPDKLLIIESTKRPESPAVTLTGLWGSTRHRNSIRAPASKLWKRYLWWSFYGLYYLHARWGFTEGKSVLCCVCMMSLIIASSQIYLWWSLCEMCAGVIVKCVMISLLFSGNTARNWQPSTATTPVARGQHWPWLWCYVHVTAGKVCWLWQCSRLCFSCA